MKRFREKGHEILGAFVAGPLAGIALWAPVYPIDYVKTLIQSDSLAKPKYRGAMDCALREKKKGVAVFYRGFGIMMARAAIVNMFVFSCFELTKKMVY